jgi:integrase
MASVSITRRRAKSGTRYVVRYRLGGRAYPIQHGGSFPRERDAKTRRDFIAGELAAGRNPVDALRSLTEPKQALSLSTWRDRFITSRHDVDVNTIANYQSSLNAFCERFDGRDPQTLSASDIAEWVAELAAKQKPGTVRQKVIAVRLLLDFAGSDPNPARDPKVKLPKQVREEPKPPSAEHVLAILDALAARWRLMFVTIEQGALRLEEAAQLKWGDVDASGLRLRLPRSATKRDKARWVYLPEMAHGGDRGDLPARGSLSGAARLPGNQRGELLSGDAPCLRDRKDPALLTARPTPSADYRMASKRRRRSRARRTRRACARVDEPRRLQPRNAARRIGTEPR